MKQLNFLKSYAKPNLPIARERFPVILFSPGAGTNIQEYENLIMQLVSHGYIVIGINSVFISGNFHLPNGTLVPKPNYSASELFHQVYSEQLNDLEFVYQKLNFQNENDPIFTAMDLKHIGTLGHSAGGLAVVDAAHQHPNWFQAVSTLDEGLDSVPDVLEKYYSPVTGPILYLYAAEGHAVITKYLHTPLLVTDNAFSAVITPSLTNQTYSVHNNFTDYSTLQYQPLINKAIAYAKKTGQAPVGDGDGYDIANSITAYLLAFFDFYLKSNGVGANPFSGCIPLAKNTVLICGPNVNS